jgi:sensor c-di-GMP phosphodiesterase-like protein
LPFLVVGSMAEFWKLRLARIAVRRGGFWGIAVTFAVICAIVSALILFAVAPSLDDEKLQVLDSQLLRRAELTADHAIIALADLFESGSIGCDEKSIKQFRKTIYRYSALKDVRVSDSTLRVRCSANPEALQTDSASEAREPTLAAANKGISLFQVSDNGNVLLGIRWMYDDVSSLEAVVNTSSLLFDILPQDLRENGWASLSLSNGESIADSDAVQPGDPSRVRVVSSSSIRYPLVASIEVDVDTLAKANRALFLIVLALFSAIGFGFGIFVAALSVQSAGSVAEIDAALDKEEFVPFVQPVCSLATREIVGVEVLARWRKADGTLIPPDRFIPIAEASGRIGPLMRHLATTALSELHDHLRRNRQFKVAFNIAPTQLLSDGFVGELRRIAVGAGVSPRQIVVEITERQEIADVEKAAQVLAELRDRGFQVAFDDVGTGHNGLSYLQKLGADIIKIDKFLVDAVMTSHSAKVLVEMLVNVGRELDMSTVAEGIETEEQFVLLKRCGVDQGQGYLLSRPLSIEDFLRLIATSAERSAFAGDCPGPAKQAMIA